MEIRDGFADALTAIAESTPRNAIENLLMGLMPRVPVQTKRVDVDNGGRAVRQPLTEQSKDYLSRFGKIRAPRTRAPRSGQYEVVSPHAAQNHRPGTWRHAMVSAATNYVDTDEDGRKLVTQQQALAYLQERYPHHYGKGIDFSWCVSVGYIKL